MKRLLPRPNAVLGAVLAATALLAAPAAEARDKSPQVSEVRLYTMPAKPACGETVRLVTEIRTTGPGKIDFTLMRRVGRNEKASLTTDKAGDVYMKSWSKEFVYRHSVTREYKVVLDGHQIATDWIAVNVKCGEEPEKTVSHLMPDWLRQDGN
ncbi:MAG: hypothetical protein R3D45_06925 [Rhizobiaceae bacterium]